MKKKKSFQKKPQKPSGHEREGLLVAHYGASADVEDIDGKIIRCHLRKNLESVITGDHVLWEPEFESKDTGVIVDFLPRKSLLVRPEGRNKLRPLAANIDAIIIITAPQTLFEHLLDRFLIAAEYLKIPPLILFNKDDLLDETAHAEIAERLAVYQALGYPTLFSSAKTQHGLDELETFIKDKTCVLVGASGVGKSSITAAFTQNESIRIGETSLKGQGKHTTTHTRLYHLPKGGNLIDSPGVREFALWHMNPEDILQGFIEFKPYLNQCKYRNCRHGQDVGCAIVDAVEQGKISEKRFMSYQELVGSTK